MFENPQNSNLMKIFPVGAELFYADLLRQAIS